MKFGPVPVGDAEGAILAHAVALGQGQGKLRKGTPITAEHVSALSAAGIGSVVVARLEAGDIPEDTAAARLATALVGQAVGLSVGVASTGRVNLRAQGPGLIGFDADAIHAVNRVNPGITVATVPQFHRLEPRSLVATIKIIPYAVPAHDLDTACRLADGAMLFHAPVVRSACLIETRIDDETPPDKGRRAIAGRLERLGVQLSKRVVVPHAPEPIAAALKAARDDIVLILTGSATSDAQDTAPSGLRSAGGALLHYGMPVDPGNLLFLGHQADRPVIGLPGCARSPALNGADWVLERVVCGVDVGPDDIAAMGVGGLLKDIPSRPLPRGRIDSDPS